jgi:hypothetical protein
MTSKQLLGLGLAAAAMIASCKDNGPTDPDPSQLQYDIDVRFFGPAMTASQQALFQNAAARIKQIVTGDIVAAGRPSQPVNLRDCDTVAVTTSIPIQEQIDDVIIYASIKDIDGAGKVVASAGPCFTRPTSVGTMTAIGLMFFDSADLNSISQGGSLQDVITHEMLHVLGVGTLWNTQPPTPAPSSWPHSPPFRSLLTDTNTTAPKYVGANARQGCIAAGGSTVCASFVPVEGLPEPRGTRDAHWRENTFNQEMMTGFIDATAPISGITIGSLQDLGFVVDASKADAYTVPATGFLPSMAMVRRDDWERVIYPVASILPNGRVIKTRLK